MGDSLKPLPKEELEAGAAEMVKRLDADNTGSISFQEFMDLLFANEEAVKLVAGAPDARFAAGLDMFNVIADQFLAGDFSLKDIH